MTRTVKFEKDPNALTSPKLLVAVGYYEAIEDMHISHQSGAVFKVTG